MVNEAATTDRRERRRVEPADHGVLGQAKLNPFGDLNALQHLSARLAKGVRQVFEPLLRAELRCWAEPLEVLRAGDDREGRPDRLTAWVPLSMTPGGTAQLVLDGRFVLELLDLFFGGSGAVAVPLPTDFSPAGEALIARIAGQLAAALDAAWAPLAPVRFGALPPEANYAAAPTREADEAVVVTRFGLARGDAKPVHLDLCYPVDALRPHGPALTGRVVEKAGPDPAWRNGLTRAAMGVRFCVRSVLAEPVVPLSLLMNLKPGDVIPIAIGDEVPVMIGRSRIGAGTVGIANGQAAVRLTRLAPLDEGLNA